jgi:glycosyltransferase involved in cell wall biosynthesis
MIGGGERYVQSLAAAMAERVDCSLVSFGPARETRRIGRLRLEIFPHIELIGGSLIDPLAYSFLTELDGAGVVHCHQHVNAVSALAIAAGRAAGARVFATDLGGAGTDLTRKYPLFELLDGFLAISRFSADRLPAHPNKRVIWGGVDEHLLAPAGPARRDRVVCVARLLPHKGIDCLIDAVDADTPLDLVGRPYHADYYALLRRRAKGKQVRFVTDATDEDVGRAYRAAGVVVLPSVYRDVWGHTHPNAELFGLALAEGMATGAPAVCTAVGAMPEVVEHGVTGFVVPPNDPAALGGRIRQLLKDTEAARAMGAAARRRVLERFTWGAVVEQCLAAYAGAGAHPQWERGAGA